jgi:hypothetical protein
MIKILVCGGRDYTYEATVFKTLDYYLGMWGSVYIIQGGARGADALAKKWAKDRKQKWTEFKADWATFGKAAGPIRNKVMLETSKPDFVVSFKGGHGTANMVMLAKAAGVSVVYVSEDFKAKLNARLNGGAVGGEHSYLVPTV